MPLENVTAHLAAPQGLTLCPILPPAPGQIFAVCAALAPHGNGFRSVLVRSTLDARVYLAALTDASGAVREWLELWVQSIDGLASSPAAQRDQLSNERLDRLWTQRLEAFRVGDPEGMIETGWDAAPLPPIFLDPVRRVAVTPADPAPAVPTAAAGETTLTFCRDDALLTRSGLPAHGASLHRYWQSGTAENARVRFAVTAGAPTTPEVRPYRDALPALASLIALNPEGGRMFVRRFSPVAFDEFADLISGKPWKGVVEGREPPALEPVYRGLEDWDQTAQSGRHLLIAARGRAALLAEALHLKLRLFIDAVESVRLRVKATQLPFLNLTDRSFRVELAGGGSLAGLPVLWTARVRPSLPGQAMALSVKTGTARYFLALESPSASVYRPHFVATPIRGSGQVRVRRMGKGTGDETVLEGTLIANEKLDTAANDLVWIRLPLDSGRHDLFARIDYAEGLARGEARFRTLGQELPPETIAKLKAIEGVPYADTPFETIPLLSTPCDLYALGMLGARALLGGSGVSMGVIADELLSLARQLGLDHDAQIPLGKRVRQTVERDPRLLDTLGPHRLLHAAIPPAEALAIMPVTLWWEAIGTLARFFPGQGPDAFCKDFGDAPPFALDAVFERPLDELNKLLVKSRSMLVIDWTQNREIAAQIHRAIEASLF